MATSQIPGISRPREYDSYSIGAQLQSAPVDADKNDDYTGAIQKQMTHNSRE